MSTATAPVEAYECDIFTYNGVDYFVLDNRGNAYEDHLIVVRNIETGVITIRPWRPDYCNGGYFAGERASHELLGGSNRLAWDPDGGPSLFECASIIDDVQAQLALRGEVLDGDWIDIFLPDHWSEASVDYCLELFEEGDED